MFVQTGEFTIAWYTLDDLAVFAQSLVQTQGKKSHCHAYNLFLCVYLLLLLLCEFSEEEEHGL